MPTYDYECIQCGYTFEAVQNMSDKALSKCPKCNKKVRRVIGGGVGLIFKGSGFYATDYKKQARPEPHKTEGACHKGKESCHGCPHA